jgi:hypothetical protein
LACGDPFSKADWEATLRWLLVVLVLSMETTFALLAGAYKMQESYHSAVVHLATGQQDFTV